MSVVVVDDHLLGDVIGGATPRDLARLLRRHEVATTNLYYYRLCRAALASPGGTLTRSWSPGRRAEAVRTLTTLVPDVQILAMRRLAFRMAELAKNHGLSALAAEAVAAAEANGAELCVWEGDDGPNTRTCCGAVGVSYRTISRE